ncbi:hypothetical protein IMSAGC014_01823 [Bacteroidaceae bacterium]|nr:hypothetical protein IMSAGC014_01823 [Bacteroidaceae bacterium]
MLKLKTQGGLLVKQFSDEAAQPNAMGLQRKKCAVIT